MGMCDHLCVEAALLDPEHLECSFRTKSRACSLSDYTVTADGRLRQRLSAEALRGIGGATVAAAPWRALRATPYYRMLRNV